MSRLKVGVLLGGFSREREVSLKSGAAIAAALERRGHEAVPIDVLAPEGPWRERILEVDAAFLALHGGFGEGGRMQRVLERCGVPFTGSGSRASALCLDKAVSKMILRSRGIPVPRGILIDYPWRPAAVVRQCKRAHLGWPVVCKPRREGSSIGVRIVRSEDDLPAVLEESAEFDEGLLIEEYLDGRELTVGVLGDEALPIVELQPKNEFFDYEAKYVSDAGTEYLIDPVLPAATAAAVRELARSSHELLGCQHLSRVDIRLDAQGRPYVLEVNTLPGFTETSLLPKAASAVGLGFDALCERLVHMARSEMRLHGSAAWHRTASGSWQTPSGTYGMPFAEIA